MTEKYVWFFKALWWEGYFNLVNLLFIIFIIAGY